MAEKRNRPSRPLVRALNPSGACGNIDHMTIDELKARAVGENFQGRCPACGMYHLTRSDIEIVKSEKISKTKHYTEMKRRLKKPKIKLYNVVNT